MNNNLRRIAVLDDDEGVRNSIARLLRISGYVVVVFATGESLLEAQASEPFECVLTDLSMEGLSGLEVQQRLSALYPDLPVILISASADAITLTKAADNGFAAALPKPCEGKELLSVIEHALREARPGLVKNRPRETTGG